jgi:hypothetical protein
MKSLKTRLFAAVGAAAMILSVPLTASAFDDEDLLDLDLSDVKAAIANIGGICTKLLVPVQDNNIVALDVVDDLGFDVNDVADLDNSLNGFLTKWKIANLHNSLNNANILTDGGVVKGDKWLSENDIDVSDVFAGLVDATTGDIIILGCKDCTSLD